ncbi:cell surface protein [Listeria floridensis FSL S10-1187]|uniref:Cell surface protein n=1 Tax=Listeria floridensis FSL S10-1187 TaxID=1265817 RepID=A0ABN0RCI0_9LIST|nr:WxL domain-containing protein [Listeria floridensis]EUJ27202.1 cell surface protein [Listeria floridensis FSL S10-1187]
MKKFLLTSLLVLAMFLSLFPQKMIQASSYDSQVGLTLTGEQKEPKPSQNPPNVHKPQPIEDPNADDKVKQSGILPHTGDQSELLYPLCGAVLLTGLIAFWLLKRKKRKHSKAKVGAMLAVILAISLFPISEKVAAKSSTSSKADIYYASNFDSTNPVDPNDPGNEVVPHSDQPIMPGTPGPLSIDFASNIQFGKHEISGKTETYFAELTSVTVKKTGITKKVPNYVQVTDNRGTLSGYRLTVKQNGQLKSGSNVLKGAEIKFLNSTLKSAGSKKYPQSVNVIALDPNGDSSSDVIIAKFGTGPGTWVNAFGGTDAQARKSVQVVLPNETKKVAGNYTTSLTWELIDSPY